MAIEGDIRVGLVGSSWFMDLWHMPALKLHPQARVVAVASATPERAQAFAQKHGIERVYPDYVEMMDSGVDAVVIVTSNEVHAPAALAATERKIAVSCEKPLARNSAEALAMAESARRNGVVSMTNFTYRDHPFLKKMQELVRDGYIGEYYSGHFAYLGGYGLGGLPGWRGTRSRSGLGILGDLGSHLVDMSHMVTGQLVSSVSGNVFCTSDGKPLDYDDPRAGDQAEGSASFVASFERGAQATFHTSWLAAQGNAGQTQEIHLFGSKGALHFLATHHGGDLRGIRHGESIIERFLDESVLPHDFEAEASEERFRPWRLTENNSTYRFIEAVRRGEPLVPSFDEGYRAQAVVDAVVKASQEKRWVNVTYAL